MKVKLTNGNKFLPERANPTDAGADLRSPIDTVIHAYDYTFIDLQFQIEIPEGYCGMIFARSGLGSKHGIKPRNCVGIIDSAYRGNVGVMLENDRHKQFEIKAGDRIAQMVIVPVFLCDFEQVDELTDTERGVGGFGSTGVK